MTTSQPYTRHILIGMAQDLNDASAGVYRGLDGEFTAPADKDVRGIFFSDMPEFPDEAIAITRFDEDPGILAINEVHVQVMSRVRNTLDGEDLVDLIRDTFHNRTGVQYGPTRFNRIRLDTSGPLGVDSNGRFVYSQNFVLTGNRYSTRNP